jgi:hypothetical protein
MGGPQAWELGVGLTTPHRKNKLVTKCYKGPRTCTGSLNKRPELRKMDIIFCWKCGTVTNQNLIQKGIKSRLNSGNACYHSVQNLLSPCLLSRNVKIRIYKTIILPVVLFGCETWSLTLRDEHRLTVVENRLLKRIFGPKRNEAIGSWTVKKKKR